MLRLAGLFDRGLGAVTSNLGKKHDYSSAKAPALLGWTPQPMEDTVLDCACSLIAASLV